MTNPKFKYTVRKNGTLYVVYPVKGLKNPVWRICRNETQAGVDAVIKKIKAERKRKVPENIPENAAEFFDFWLETKKISDRTLESYRNNINRYLRPALGSLSIREVKSKHFLDLIKKLDYLEPQTIKKLLGVASMIFDKALTLNKVAQNPVPEYEADVANNKVKIMNLDEAQRFIRGCEDSAYGIIFEFALETGMRPQEYLALRWSDVDFRDRLVKVERNLVYEGKGFYFKNPAVKQAYRFVSITPEMCEKLEAHRARQNILIDKLENKIKGHYKPSRESRREFNRKALKNFENYDLIFSSREFTPFSEKNLSSRYFKNILKMSGLEGFTLYSLRYTCIYRMIREGVNPALINERLGYASFSWADNIYNQMPAVSDSEAMEKFFAVFNKEEESKFLN